MFHQYQLIRLGEVELTCNMDIPNIQTRFLTLKKTPEKYVCMERCLNNTGGKHNAV